MGCVEGKVTAMREDRERDYEEMTAEELELRFRETFFYPDRIDETVYLELERLRAALEKKQPLAFDRTAEDFWESFAREHGEELDRCCAGEAERPAARKTGRRRGILRSVLIAAVIAVLLAGAALAADYAGLWAWTPRWNAAAGRYEPAAQEVSGESPIPAALAELGITEPLYPAKLPKGFTLTESRISKDPLVLMEQYAHGDQRLSITVTPIKGFETVVYQKGGEAAQEYKTGKVVHYVYETDNTLTAIWYTEHYATSVSGNLTRQEIKGIIDSIYERSAG